MELKKLDMPLSVIQVENLSDIDLSVTPLFLGKTEDELYDTWIARTVIQERLLTFKIDIFF